MLLTILHTVMLVEVHSVASQVVPKTRPPLEMPKVPNRIPATVTSAPGLIKFEADTAEATGASKEIDSDMVPTRSPTVT